ncbi:MAG: polar amino acid transport system substrate-binding protein [Candidatus Endobugula sp.]|jgi:polar amino acid transport system substrate-binding protein
MTKKCIKMLSLSSIAALVLTSAAAIAEPYNNDTWNKIIKSGKITVGVKADTKPWGFLNTNGELIGMEADMAKEVADTMGVELELVGVQSSNRMQFLEQGKIDLMIATMSDRLDRRKLVGVALPNYYSSGTNVMAPKALKLTKWSQLKGRDVCGKQGTFYNKVIEKRYGAKVVAFTGNAEAKQALRDKKCVAWVYDDSVIAADLASGNFDDFEMPFKTEDDNPWALAVPLAEQSSIFGRFMSGMQYNWHQSGRLLELEEKWGIKASSYLIENNERFSEWLSEAK